MQLGELFVKLGVKSDVAKVEQFQKALNNTEMMFQGLKLAAITTALYGLERFIDSTVRSTVALQNLNIQTGISTQTFQKWGAIGQMGNLAMGANDAANAIAGLSLQLAKIKVPVGSPQQALAMLGVSNINAPIEQIIQQIASKAGKMDAAIYTSLVSQLLGAQFVPVLYQMRANMDAINKLNFLNRGELARIKTLGMEIKNFKIEIGLLKDHFVAGITPALLKALQLFTSFSQILGYVMRTFKVTDAINNWSNSIIIALTAVTFALNPLLGGFMALLLVLDDLATYMRGGDSLIGDLLNPFKGVTKEDIKKTPLLTWGGKDVLGVNLGDVGDVLTKPSDMLGKALDYVTNFNVSNVFNINSTAPASEVGDAVADKIGNTLETASAHLNN